MNNTALALLVGLLAGVAGGFVPKLVASDAPEGGGDRILVDKFAGSDVEGRLARIEAAVERLAGGGLSVGGDPALKGTAPIRIAIDDASMAEFKEATKATVKETLAEMKEAEDETSVSLQGGERRGGRKRMKLADAAAEMGLSSAEEEDVRRVYEETMEKAFKLLAGENGDIEEVRRDIQSVRDDPSKRFTVFGKYMPRVIPKIGEFMSLDAERRRRVEEAVGKDKARDLERKYDIEEANPLGIGGNMRFETRMEGNPVRGR